MRLFDKLISTWRNLCAFYLYRQGNVVNHANPEETGITNVNIVQGTHLKQRKLKKRGKQNE